MPGGERVAGGHGPDAPGDPALRVALIAPPWYPLPPHGYGGTESVVTLLARELRARGHEVTVYGCDGSEAGTTAVVPAGWHTSLGTAHASPRELLYLSRVLTAVRGRAPDVVHDHSGIAGVLGAVLVGVAPVVHTVHLRVDEPLRDLYREIGAHAALVAVSAAQRATAPGVAWAGVVHNAVDVDALRVRERIPNGGPLVCLARISPDKGQHIAIEVARRTGRRLVIAGKVEESERARTYFRDHVRPHIDGARVRYVPNVAGRDKADLLAGAAALLAPVAWPEPFGLSVVEAMASGTPAISFDRGAARELIEEGRTGYVVGDADAMVGAVAAAAEIDRRTCAALTRSRFHPRVMTEAYLDVYREAAGLHLAGVARRAAGAA